MNKNYYKIIVLILTATFLLETAGVFAIDFKEQAKQIRTKYQEAKQNYLKEVDFYKNARQEFLKARENFKNLKNAENKEALVEKLRTFLKHSIEVMIKRLEALKNKTNARGISEEERAAIIVELDKDINWLKGQLPKIDTATPAELKDIAKTIREHWQNNRVKVKRVIGMVMVGKIEFLLNKAASSSQVISEKISELKKNNYDTAQLEAWLSDFNSKIALAKDKYEQAKAKFFVISDTSNVNQLFKEGHQFIKEAHKYLKEAHQILIKIITEIKKITKPEKATTTPATTTP